VAGVNKNRKVTVPGQVLEVSYVAGGDQVRNAVVAIPHADRIVMVFYAKDSGPPSAWSMTTGEANKFTEDVKAAYLAIADDAKIAQLEREFGAKDDAD
jgi:hypothetical protein